MGSVAGVSRGQQQAFVWSLVLSSMRIQNMVVRSKSCWVVLVGATDESEARHEIAAFEQENCNWPPDRGETGNEGILPDSPPAVIPVMGALLVFYAVTGPWKDGSIWFQQGGLSESRVLGAGEWWRVVSALTLHADSGHVLGNVLIGGFLAYFLCRQLGGGLAWLLILFSGALGNAVNVLLQSEGYQSVGFSTAVFGTVGLLSGLAMARKGALKELMLPFGSALALLAFLGAGKGRTDLGAHLWGLIVGICLGLTVAMQPSFLRWTLIARNQWFLRGVAAFIVIASWWAALATP